MNEVTIKSTARIHTALLNESGYGDRIDGSIGFSIDSPAWEIRVSRETFEAPANLTIDAELLSSLNFLKTNLQEKFHIKKLSYEISGGIKSHVGLGSKTALLLGFANAVNKLFELNLSPLELATETGRGGTSGIGYWASQKGGFLWDAGRAYPTEKSKFGPSSISKIPPPALVTSIPIENYYICHFRFSHQGIFGDKEKLIFQKHCPTNHEETQKLLALTSNHLVPSILSDNEPIIQETLAKIQNIGLKSIEWNYQDSETKKFRRYWESKNIDIALCLSSMGSTMYCMTKEPERIKSILAEYSIPPLHYQTAKILNG